MKIRKTLAIVFVFSVVLSTTGCKNVYDVSKQQMIEDWHNATAKAQMPVINDLIEQGQYAQAQKRIKQVLKSHPDNSYALYLMGVVHANLKQVLSARAVLIKALDINSELHEAWSMLATLSQYEKDYPKALTYYQKAYEIVPANSDYAIGIAVMMDCLDRTDEARQMLDDKLAGDVDNVELMIALADIENRSGNTQRAIELYDRAMLIDGQNSEVLESLVYCYTVTEQWHKASQIFERLYNQEQIPERKTAFRKALAMSTYHAGRYAQALKHYDALSVQLRDDPEVWLRMAQCALAGGEANRSIYCAQKALALQPTDAETLSILGCAQYTKGDYDAAMDSFGSLLIDGEYSSLAWFMTGRCYQQLGDGVLANDAFAKSKELNPDSRLMKFVQ